MTSLPQALTGTRPQYADISEFDSKTLIAALRRDHLAIALPPETLMVALLAVCMIVAGLICGMTALYY